MTDSLADSLAADDRFVRLSDSPLWQRQRDFFVQRGPSAWSAGEVPHYVTSTPFLARAYADVIAGFADDVVHQRAGDEATVYVIELGAGTGRLGFAITRALAAIADGARRGWRVVYVLTDFAEATVDWWHEHPWLRPLTDAGVLDVAVFDLTSDDAITLRVSGRSISVDEPVDAMAVVANYVFDSVPQDAFIAADGHLCEYLADAHFDVDINGRGFTTADLAYRRRAIQPVGYYGDPVLDGILASYRHHHGAFTFPAPALAGLARLRATCAGPWLLLSGDKGESRRVAAMTDTPPALVVHGSVSMTVNYHAIGAWAGAHGGLWMHAEHHSTTLEICCVVLGVDQPTASLAGYERAVAQRSPDDFYALKRVLVTRAHELTLDELLAYLRLSGYDVKVLLDCADAIRGAIVDAPASVCADLVRALARVWDGHLPIGERDDLAFTLGALSAQLGRDRDAVRYFEASILVCGVRAETCRRLAQHYAALAQPERATAWHSLARTSRARVTPSPPPPPSAPPPIEDPFAWVTAASP